MWLIFTRRGIEIDQYPAIKKYLEPFKEQLLKRATAHTHPWYELQQPQEGCWQEFERSKIIYPDIAVRCEFTFDTNHLYPDCTLFLIPGESTYLVGILNSNIVQFFIDQICPAVRGNFRRFKSIYIEKIPIPAATDETKKTIETLVSYILFLTKELKDIPSHGAALAASAEDKLMLSYFEQLVNAVVLELYLSEELHAQKLSFSPLLHTEMLLPMSEIQGDKISVLRTLFKKLYTQDHPIRRNLFLLDTVPAVRLIGGKAL